MIYRPIALAAFLGVMVAACATPTLTQAQNGMPDEAQKLRNDLSQLKDRLKAFLQDLSAKIPTDLQDAQKAAEGAQPPDTAGANCYAELIKQQPVVKQLLDAVEAAAKKEELITGAEVLTLLLPGSPQTNAIRDALVQACAVKVTQVTNEITVGGAWFVQIGALFAPK